jgi:D-3-phosphoglycerate dehydrogenase
MNVIIYDPNVSNMSWSMEMLNRVAQELVRLVRLTHCTCRSTCRRDLFGRLAFCQMSDGVVIVSTARGGIIDEAALLNALNSRKVAGAALDVFEKEPPGLTDLVLHPRVITTPHIGAQTAEAQSRAAEDIANEVLSALRGESLRWKVA